MSRHDDMPPRWWKQLGLWLWLKEKDATAGKERRWQDQYDVLEKHLEDAYADIETLTAERDFALDANFDLRAEVAVLRKMNDSLMTWCPADLSELDQ
jgi:hypothetical protein